MGPPRRWTRLLYAVLLAVAVATDVAASVDVHFESKDGGFFLKHNPRQFYATSNQRPDLLSAPDPSTTSSSAATGVASSTVLSIDKFTVFQTSEPVSVRASYGPFSTKQTVPARYIVPDPLDALPLPNLDGKRNNASGAALVDVQELGARHLDMSAHVVSTSVARDSPVLRVLFHAGSEATGRRQVLLGRHQRVCVLLHATPNLPSRAGDPAIDSLVKGPLTAACSPDGQDGVCLAQITVPASWWPPLPPPDTAGRKPVKTLPRMVQLSYSVLEPRTSDDSGHPLDASSASFCQPKVQIQPATPLGQVTLAPNRATYKELKTDEYLTLLVPHGPLYPRSRLHVPVFLQSHSSKQSTQARPPIAAVILRARVKAGVKILDASSSSADWIVESDINTKNTAATFTARRKENVSRLPNASAEEIMTMLLEASDESSESKEHGGGGRIVWSVRYALEGEEDNVSLSGPFQATQPQHHHHHNGNGERKKLQAHLEIQKDDIQAVLPISKNWEVMNTAVLTGKQISQAMKVFIVSQAGTVADVTLQSSCHSEDESVLKVSSSCSSVYVDGSEIRGSSNASVLVKYGTYTGLARFTVWMPEFPLEVSVTDTRLNQIKGWKVPEDAMVGLSKNKRNSADKHQSLLAPGTTTKKKKKRDAATPLADEQIDDGVDGMVDKEDEIDYDDDDDEEEEEEEEEEEDDDEDEEDGRDLSAGKMRYKSGDKYYEINTLDKNAPPVCRLRFQQSPVEVHARFLAVDHDSGRVSYFVNRRTWLRITDLVGGHLRVSDPRIATLVQNRIVQGRGIGKTEVQVLSPITARVIGAKEIRVGNDRVSISQLSVKVVSGLQLTISPDAAIENGYVAETSVTRKLTAQYQEGLLDIDIEFSDGTRTPLRDIAVSDYQLAVESLDPDVVAFAPMVASKHPRVIAVGEGHGDLMRVSLQLTDTCRLLQSRRTKATAARQVSIASVGGGGGGGGGGSSGQAAPLATATANVEVDFSSSDLPNRPEFVQNDGGVGLGNHHRDRKTGKEMAPDLHDILIGGMGGVGIRHNGGPRMTPLEIGMYVLLAAFCFAIVVFVVSCVVYASKFKPQPDNVGLPGLPIVGAAARAAASQFTHNRNRHPRESTTNAHDWVWLGRATLERAACAPQQVRVTSNPLANEPEDETMDLATSFDNPNHVELPSANLRANSASSNERSGPIDSTTYCKRDRTSKSFANKHPNSKQLTTPQRNDNDNVPPPLPPHKTPIASNNGNDNGNEDYKPPVPPHRNTGAMVRNPETPKRRHHHQRANSSSEHVSRRHGESGKSHHHHRKSSRSKANGGQSNNASSSAGSAAPVHDFTKVVDNDNDDFLVQVRSKDPESHHKRGRSREIKRATVVGNPMFSSSSSSNSSSHDDQASEEHRQHQQQQQQQQTSAATASSSGGGAAALDDLNLGMDYNQIMQYFENLKESNA